MLLFWGILTQPFFFNGFIYLLYCCYLILHSWCWFTHIFIFFIALYFLSVITFFFGLKAYLLEYYLVKIDQRKLSELMHSLCHIPTFNIKGCKMSNSVCVWFPVAMQPWVRGRDWKHQNLTTVEQMPLLLPSATGTYVI